MPELLPALPHMVQGVVGVEYNDAGRKVFTLQCQHCGAFEKPWPLVLMTFKFCPIHDKDHGHDRLCPDCRHTSLTAQGWTDTQARRIITDGHPI